MGSYISDTNLPILPNTLPNENFSIRAVDIRKRFGTFEALRGVTFDVPKHSVFSILGPNGAGKTTLLRILTTITRPNAGTATIEGFNIQSQVYQVREQIGVVAQDNHFDRYLSIWHNLALHAQMHGLNNYQGLLNDLLHQVGLYERRNDSPEVLSGGMKRRVSLIRALIHQPSVLFLDEPTTGLDPQARRDLWATIRQFKQRATIILTTHYLDEADMLSDHIMMLHRGQVVMTGTPQALKQRVAQNETYELVFRQPNAQQWLEPVQTVTPNTRQVNSYRLLLEPTGAMDWIQLLQVVPSSELLRFGWVEPDLETVFFQVANETAG